MSDEEIKRPKVGAHLAGSEQKGLWPERYSAAMLQAKRDEAAQCCSDNLVLELGKPKRLGKGLVHACAQADAKWATIETVTDTDDYRRFDGREVRFAVAGVPVVLGTGATDEWASNFTVDPDMDVPSETMRAWMREFSCVAPDDEAPQDAKPPPAPQPAPCAHKVPVVEASAPYSAFADADAVQRRLRAQLTAKHRAWPTCPQSKADLTLHFGHRWSGQECTEFTAAWWCPACGI